MPRKPQNLSRDIRASKLSNGLNVVTEVMPHVRSVSAGIWIDSGSRTEAIEQNGIAHFIEHMVFKGTKKRSAEDIARTMDALGGHLDAFTGKELVSFNAKVIDEHLPIAMDVLSDLVLNPAFRADDVEREKGVVLEELKMEADAPEYVIHEAFISNFWRNHPLGRPILGTRETIGSFDPKKIRSYWSKVYAPANIVITAAGSVNHDRFVEMVHNLFGDVAPGKRLKRPAPPKPEAPRIVKQKKAVAQSQVMIGVPAYSATDDRRFAAYIMATVLGGGMSSRLFQNIREKRGLAYSVSAEISAYQDAGCLGIFAGTGKETLVEVIKLIFAELRALKNDLITEDELTRTKDHLKGSLLLGLESTNSRMSNLARQQIYFNRFPTIEETLAGINAVTREDIRKIANDLFDASRLGIGVLGDLKGFRLQPNWLNC